MYVPPLLLELHTEAFRRIYNLICDKHGLNTRRQQSPQSFPRDPDKNTLINALKTRKPASVALYNRVDRVNFLAAVAYILEREGRRTGDSPILAKWAEEYLDGLATRFAVGHAMSAAKATSRRINGIIMRTSQRDQKDQIHRR